MLVSSVFFSFPVDCYQTYIGRSVCILRFGDALTLSKKTNCLSVAKMMPLIGLNGYDWFFFNIL